MSQSVEQVLEQWHNEDLEEAWAEMAEDEFDSLEGRDGGI